MNQTTIAARPPSTPKPAANNRRPPPRTPQTRHVWSESEVEFLKNAFDGSIESRRLVAFTIGIPIHKVTAKINKLGIAIPNQRRRWTQQELQVVAARWDGTRATAAAIGQDIDRTRIAVRGAAVKMGLTKTKPPRWTPQEDDTIRQMIGSQNLDDIAKATGRTTTAVRIRSKRINVSPADRDNWFTLAEGEQITGKDHRWILRRINEGRLAAKRHHSQAETGQEPKMWHINEKDLAHFIALHAEFLHGPKIDLNIALNLLADFPASRLKVTPPPATPPMPPPGSACSHQHAQTIRQRYAGNRRTEQQIAHIMELSATSVRRRAAILGICRENHPERWSERHDGRLRALARRGLSIPAISREMNRSLNDVAARLRKLVNLARPRGKPYTAGEAAAILGVSEKWLTKTGRITLLQPNAAGLIAEPALRTFILEHIPDINGRNIDTTAVVAIVARIKPRRPTHLPQPTAPSRRRRRYPKQSANNRTTPERA